ncbi:nucleotidyltransferase domain-containing protein [Naasia sp. SYSU D00057]|uniref:nucleotidyltransferase domain-containing protein n=1 Tax=Naasia sp. SYSU D00057 TaxID=2817380 RepID=UPI0027DB2720|nr:lincomycin resistance protein LmrB [Naasia sp. SYSU D00057]
MSDGAAHGGMPSDEVMTVVEWLEHSGAVYQVNGGWAVDALVGRQTRVHRDLDVFLDEAAVPRLIAWLTERGYTEETDELPARVELRRGEQVVDVHPMALDAEGNGVQRGGGDAEFVHRATDRTRARVAGRPVTVARVERLIELRRGYRHRDVDAHDLAQLRRIQAAGAGEGSVEA